MQLNNCFRSTSEKRLRIVLDDYDSDCDVLLIKSGKVTMEMKRLRVLWPLKFLKQSIILIQTIYMKEDIYS